MKIFWIYLKPYQWLVLLSLLLAAIAQALTLFDPIIFGKIIDNYALNPNGKSENELVNGVLFGYLSPLALPFLRDLQNHCRSLCCD
jgi:ATP-binding cassette subfamily B protein